MKSDPNTTKNETSIVPSIAQQGVKLGYLAGPAFAAPSRMRKLVNALAISVLLLGSASAAQAQVSFSFRFGPPPAPRAFRVAPRPGPDYVWIEGYWYPQNNRYVWHDGYWTRPPNPGAYWVDPYYANGRYFSGYWQSSRGVMRHDHRWDRSRDRDDHRNGWQRNPR